MMNDLLKTIVYALKVFRVGSGGFQVALAGTGKVDDCCQWLVHFVGNA